MRNQARMAWAALAIGLLADAAPSAAQRDRVAEVVERLDQSGAQADSTGPVDRSRTAADAAEPATRSEWQADVAALLAEAEDEADTRRPAATPDWQADVAALLAEADDEVDEARPGLQAVSDLVDWVITSGDNGGRPFIVIDKVAAAVFVYDGRGAPGGDAPALLGIASGDDSTPGIGDRELSEMGPEERTTPAGRFAAQIGPAAGGHNVLWVDYATSVALHPVVTGNRRERRQQRLSSPSPDDNRITYGCINVPVAFYREVIRPLFEEAGGIVYILPETRPVEEVFPGLRMRLSATPRNRLPTAESLK